MGMGHGSRGSCCLMGMGHGSDCITSHSLVAIHLSFRITSICNCPTTVECTVSVSATALALLDAILYVRSHLEAS